MKELNVVYLADDNYVVGAGTSIVSLFENNKQLPHIRVYYMASTLKEENRQKLLELAKNYGRELIFLDTSDIDKLLEENQVPKYKGITYAPIYRWFAISKIQENIERLLYIDSDTVIVGNLEGILDLELTEKPIFMAIDYMWDFFKEGIGIEKDSYYFNTGVILFNVKQWKEGKFEQRIIDHIRNGKANYPFFEQDIANVVLADYTEILDLKYNVYAIFYLLNGKALFHAVGLNEKNYYSLEAVEKGIRDAVIHHCSKFEGTRPWDRNSTHPYQKEFDYYLAMSPWKDYEKKDVKLNRTMKIQKILYKILPKSIFSVIYRMAQKRYMGNLLKKTQNNK